MRLTRHQANLSGVQRGFTLLEMIGVLTIILVLVAALLPAWIRRIDLAVRQAEVSNLVTVSNALVEQIIRGAAIHNENTWTQAVADWTMLPTVKVATNARRYQRFYFYEQGANPGPSWRQVDQGADGLTSPPVKGRAIILTVLGGDPLETVTGCPYQSSGQLGETFFDPLWSVLPDSKPPSAWANNWNGKGEDFLVQRVNYATLFRRLMLLNRDPTPVAFTINGVSKALAQTSPNYGWASHYLQDTVVGLCDTNSQVMTRHVLKEDIGFVFENGMWRAEIVGAPESDSTGDEFSRKATLFLNAARNNDASKASNQRGIVTAMYSYMLTYVFWAEQCPPHFPTRGIEAENVPEYLILKSLGIKNGHLDVISSGLIN